MTFYRLINPNAVMSFQTYFAELGISIVDWPVLFDEMNHDPQGNNYAFLRLQNGNVIGFIMPFYQKYGYQRLDQVFCFAQGNNHGINVARGINSKISAFFHICTK